MHTPTQTAHILPESPAPQRTKCEIYTRVMGYFRPVSHFNIGKKAEHYNRVHFKENQSATSRFIQTYAPDADCVNSTNNACGLSG